MNGDLSSRNGPGAEGFGPDRAKAGAAGGLTAGSCIIPRVILPGSPPRNIPDPKKAARVFLAVLILGGAVRLVDVFRPADGRVRESWRECDYAAVARNFAREGMNIFRPRIDWRGNGPGFAEMELPVIPWTMAVFYKIFGVHEVIGRVLMWVVSLLTLRVFFALARRFLPWEGAAAAGLFFALSPLSVRVSNSLQPEGLMLLLLLSGVFFFLRWLEGDGGLYYGLAAASTAGAILVKAPAAHIGILLAALLIRKKGWRALLRPETWAFGVLALLPAAAWYVHAHRLFLEFGNSLGVSNETHWLGWDLIRAPRRLLVLAVGVVRMEGVFVWTPLGAAFLAVSVFLRKKSEVSAMVIWWLAAIGLYYLAAIRTLGDHWAEYYHVVAVPPAALTFGAAAAWLASRRRSSELLTFEKRLATGGFLLVLGFLSFLVVRDFHPRFYEPLFRCASAFAPSIPRGAPILVSGGPSKDETGRPVAYNAPYFFYWLDLKGWNISSDTASTADVREYAARGARFFIAERGFLDGRPDLTRELRAVFPVAAECPEAVLFDLLPRGRVSQILRGP